MSRGTGHNAPCRAGGRRQCEADRTSSPGRHGRANTPRAVRYKPKTPARERPERGSDVTHFLPGARPARADRSRFPPPSPSGGAFGAGERSESLSLAHRHPLPPCGGGPGRGVCLRACLRQRSGWNHTPLPSLPRKGGGRKRRWRLGARSRRCWVAGSAETHPKRQPVPLSPCGGGPGRGVSLRAC